MKKKISIVTTLLLAAVIGTAQTAVEVKKELDAANAALLKKDFKNADKSLTQAQMALAKFAGKEVAKILPLEINGLKADADKDQIQMGSVIMAPGNTVQRTYTNAEGTKKIDIKIKPGSPDVNSVSMFVSNPQYLKSEGPIKEKLVSVNGRKAIVKINEDLKSAEVLLVSGSTLYAVEAAGDSFKVEDMVAIASKIEVGRIETIFK